MCSHPEHILMTSAIDFNNKDLVLKNARGRAIRCMMQAELNSASDSCKYCCNITLEKLASKEGYLHAPSRTSLVRSAQKCKLCSLLFRKDRSRRASTQLRLSLQEFSEDDPQIVLTISHVVDEEKRASNAQLSLFLYTQTGQKLVRTRLINADRSRRRPGSNQLWRESQETTLKHKLRCLL